MIWIVSLYTFPDCFKGMLKGVFKSMALQHNAVYITLSGHYGINIILIWLFAFKLQYKEIGL